MKRKKIVLICFVLALFFVAGCQKENWTVYEMAGGNADTICFEYSGDVYNLVSTADYSRDAAEERKIFSFGDKEYVLSYKETCNRDFMSYHEDVYKTEDADTTFYFRTSTGELSGIFTKGEALIITEQEPEGKEDYLRLAEAILKEYIPVEEYEITCDTKLTVFETQGNIGQRSYRTEEGFYVPVNENETASYTITYRRYVGGFHSSDIAIVVLDEAGKLEQLNIGEINAFQEKNLPGLNEKDITKLISKKLNSLCREGYKIENFSQNVNLCVNENGELYFMIGVEPVVKKTATEETIKEMGVFILAPAQK